MQRIPDQSIDMILCDLPYGTTACKWDSLIPFEPLWEQYQRVVKPRSAVVLMASQPFTTALIASNLKNFRYCWVWEKTVASNFALAAKQPLKKHEDVCVFYRAQPIYNPQMQSGRPYSDNRQSGSRNASVGLKGGVNRQKIVNLGSRFPSSVQRMSNGNNFNIHPTQKPVALFEYLIRTYTNPGEVILDSCMGSGTTAIACLNAGRHYLGFEKDPKYFEAAQQRIAAHRAQLSLLEQTA